MAVMTTNTRELPINTLIRRAAQMAGIMGLEQGEDSSSPQWLAKASFGRDQLEAIIKSIGVQGALTRNIITTTTTLTAATASYALAAGTIDVSGWGQYKASSSATQEFPVRQVDREEYMAIADKTQAGMPTRMYVQKLATVTLFLHPVPDVTDSILTVQRQRILADNSDGAATADLETYWMDYLMKELSYRMSVGMPVAERSLLRGDAQSALEIAQTKARQIVPNRVELDHPTAWSR